MMVSESTVTAGFLENDTNVVNMENTTMSLSTLEEMGSESYIASEDGTIVISDDLFTADDILNSTSTSTQTTVLEGGITSTIADKGSDDLDDTEVTLETLHDDSTETTHIENNSTVVHVESSTLPMSTLEESGSESVITADDVTVVVSDGDFLTPDDISNRTSTSSQTTFSEGEISSTISDEVSGELGNSEMPFKTLIDESTITTHTINDNDSTVVDGERTTLPVSTMKQISSESEITSEDVTIIISDDDMFTVDDISNKTSISSQSNPSEEEITTIVADEESGEEDVNSITMIDDSTGTMGLLGKDSTVRDTENITLSMSTPVEMGSESDIASEDGTIVISDDLFTADDISNVTLTYSQTSSLEGEITTPITDEGSNGQDNSGVTSGIGDPSATTHMEVNDSTSSDIESATLPASTLMEGSSESLISSEEVTVIVPTRDLFTAGNIFNKTTIASHTTLFEEVTPAIGDGEDEQVNSQVTLKTVDDASVTATVLLKTNSPIMDMERTTLPVSTMKPSTSEDVTAENVTVIVSDGDLFTDDDISTRSLTFLQTAPLEEDITSTVADDGSGEQDDSQVTYITMIDDSTAATDLGENDSTRKDGERSTMLVSTVKETSLKEDVIPEDVTIAVSDWDLLTTDDILNRTRSSTTSMTTTSEDEIISSIADGSSKPDDSDLTTQNSLATTDLLEIISDAVDVEQNTLLLSTLKESSSETDVTPEDVATDTSISDLYTTDEVENRTSAVASTSTHTPEDVATFKEIFTTSSDEGSVEQDDSSVITKVRIDDSSLTTELFDISSTAWDAEHTTLPSSISESNITLEDVTVVSDGDLVTSYEISNTTLVTISASAETTDETTAFREEIISTITYYTDGGSTEFNSASAPLATSVGVSSDYVNSVSSDGSTESHSSSSTSGTLPAAETGTWFPTSLKYDTLPTTQPSTFSNDFERCDKPDGFYPIEGVCATFYRCYYKKYYEFVCPDGLHFNFVSKRCERPCEAKCDPSLDCDEKTTAIVPFASCHRPGLFPVPNDCAKYLNCSRGEGVLESCAAGLHFNATTRTCDWPVYAKCGTQPDRLRRSNKRCSCSFCLYANATSCSDYHLCMNRHVYDLKCSNGLLFDQRTLLCTYSSEAQCTTATTSTVSPSTSTNRPYRCKKRNGLFPNPEDCGGFVQCSNWRPYWMRCSAHTHFNYRTGRCDYPCDAKCDATLACPTTTVSLPITTIPECSCENCLYPDPETCIRYAECRHGTYRWKKCPRGQLYDRHRQRCDWAHRVECPHTVVCPDVNGLFEYKDDCHKYIQCSNGIPNVRDCPNDLEFEPRYQRCSWPTGRCGSVVSRNQLKPETTAAEACPKQYGLFPLSTDCSKYIQCDNNVPRIRSCPTNLLFNSALKLCDWAHNVDCQGEKDVYVRQCLRSRAQFRCSGLRGYVPDTSDCAQFIDCSTGRACLRRCPSNLLFDSNSATCVRKDEVRCAKPSAINTQEFGCAGRRVVPDSNPRCYYRCLNGVRYRKCCPVKQFFDRTYQRCRPMHRKA